MGVVTSDVMDDAMNGNVAVSAYMGVVTKKPEPEDKYNTLQSPPTWEL